VHARGAPQPVKLGCEGGCQLSTTPAQRAVGLRRRLAVQVSTDKRDAMFLYSRPDPDVPLRWSPVAHVVPLVGPAAARHGTVLDIYPPGATNRVATWSVATDEEWDASKPFQLEVAVRHKGSPGHTFTSALLTKGQAGTWAVQLSAADTAVPGTAQTLARITGCAQGAHNHAALMHFVRHRNALHVDSTGDVRDQLPRLPRLQKYMAGGRLGKKIEVGPGIKVVTKFPSSGRLRGYDSLPATCGAGRGAQAHAHRATPQNPPHTGGGALAPALAPHAPTPQALPTAVLDLDDTNPTPFAAAVSTAVRRGAATYQEHVGAGCSVAVEVHTYDARYQALAALEHLRGHGAIVPSMQQGNRLFGLWEQAATAAREAADLRKLYADIKDGHEKFAGQFVALGGAPRVKQMVMAASQQSVAKAKECADGIFTATRDASRAAQQAQELEAQIRTAAGYPPHAPIAVRRLGFHGTARNAAGLGVDDIASLGLNPEHSGPGVIGPGVYLAEQAPYSMDGFAAKADVAGGHARTCIIVQFFVTKPRFHFGGPDRCVGAKAPDVGGLGCGVGVAFTPRNGPFGRPGDLTESNVFRLTKKRQMFVWGKVRYTMTDHGDARAKA